MPLALGIVGFIVASKVVSHGNYQGDGLVPFTETPQYRLWAVIICIQTMLWFALLAPLVQSLRPFKEKLWAKPVLLKAGVVAAALAWVLLSGDYKAPVDNLNDMHPNHSDKMIFFNVVGMSVGVLAIMGLWSAQEELRRLEAGGLAGGGGPAHVVQRFLDLRSRLERHLLVAGVIVGAATLATGALRQAVLAYRPEAAADFRVEDVIGYGLSFSALLALIYAPAHAQLVRTGARLRDELVPAREDLDSWDAWNKEHKAVEELLRVQTNLLASLTGALSILTPLLGSLISILLGTGAGK